MNSCSKKATQQSVLENARKQPAKFPERIVQNYPFLLFGICFLVVWIWRFTFQGSSRLDAIVILGAAAATLLVMNQRLPLQNVVGAVVTIAVFWWATLLVAKVTGVFFFPPHFNFHFIHEYEFGLLWTIGLINSRGIAKLILQRWRKNSNCGLWMIGLSGLLLTIEDPNARKNSIYFIEKFLFVGVVFVAVTPWFIDKKRIEQKSDYQPILITILLLLW